MIQTMSFQSALGFCWVYLGIRKSERRRAPDEDMKEGWFKFKSIRLQKKRIDRNWLWKNDLARFSLARAWEWKPIWGFGLLPAEEPTTDPKHLKWWQFIKGISLLVQGAVCPSQISQLDSFNHLVERLLSFIIHHFKNASSLISLLELVISHFWYPLDILSMIPFSSASIKEPLHSLYVAASDTFQNM